MKTDSAQTDQPVRLPEGDDPDDSSVAHVGSEELDRIEDDAQTAAPTPQASASTVKTFGEIVSKLTAPTGDKQNPLPRRLLRERAIPGGGRTTYIDHQTVVRLLNTYAPGWSMRIHPVEFREWDGAMMVKVTLSIPTSDMGMVERDGVGIRKKDDKGRGDLFFGAQHQALKRAATQFGLGLYLYDRD